MRILLAPPVNNKPLKESLQKLGAKQKQIEAWLIAVNNCNKNNSLPLNNHRQIKNSSQKISQQEMLQKNYSQDLPIPTDNWDAVRLFILLATQWRINDVKPIGIDYSAIKPTAELAQIKLSQLIFEKIRFMEQETLKIFSEITTAS